MFIEHLHKSHSYIFGNECRYDTHKDGNGGLVGIGHFPIFDDMGHKDVDDEYDNEDESFDVECFCAHLKTINNQS